MSRLQAAKTGGIPVVIAVTAIVAALTLFDLATKRGNEFPGLLGSAPQVLRGFDSGPRYELVTSSSRRDPTQAYVVRREGAGVAITPILRDRPMHGAFETGPEVTVERAGSPAATHDIAPIEADDEPSLWSFSAGPGSVRVETTPLRGDAGPELDETIELPPVPAGGDRSFFAGRRSGEATDLFVIDRGDELRWTIRVFSGESLFADQLDDVVTPRVRSGDLRPGEWQLDVGPVAEDEMDFILFTHGKPSGSRRSEVHVVTGKSDYEDFNIRIPMSLAQKTKPAERFAYHPFRVGGDVIYLDGSDSPARLQYIPLSR